MQKVSDTVQGCVIVALLLMAVVMAGTATADEPFWLGGNWCANFHGADNLFEAESLHAALHSSFLGRAGSSEGKTKQRTLSLTSAGRTL